MQARLAFVMGEVEREWLVMRRYWFNTAAFIVTLCLIFAGLLLVGTAFTGGRMASGTRAELLVGLLLWIYALGMLELFSWNMSQEATSGTLEHLYLSPIGPATIFLVRGFAKLVTLTIVVAVAYFPMALVAGVRINLNPDLFLVVIPLSVANVAGMTLIFGGLMLIFKRIENFSQIIQMILMFFTGAMAPLESFPPALITISHLLPLTYGVEIARRMAVDGARLGQLQGPLLGLIVNTAVWMTLGLTVFYFCDRIARQRGTVGQY